jgi:hypothetical protein
MPTTPRQPRKMTAFRLDDDLIKAMEFVKDRDGVPISEQVRRALRAWLEERGAAAAAPPATRAKARPRRKR